MNLVTAHHTMHSPGIRRRARSLCMGTGLVLGLGLLGMTGVQAQDGLEKEDLKFGFIKLTDMAPLAIAYEKGYFEDEGLYVTLEAQANWKVLLDRVIDGALDGAHMLAGQPLGATIGFGTEAHIVTAFSMDLNGNAITVSNDVWEKMKPYVPHENGKPVHPITADALMNCVTGSQPAACIPAITHLTRAIARGRLMPTYYSR